MTVLADHDSILGVPRKENNSLYLIYPKDKPKPHFINEFVMQLWRNTEATSFSEIVKKYKTMYPNIDIEVLRQDIKKGLLILYNLRMVNISGEDAILIIDSDCQYNSGIVNEREFRKVSEYMKKVISYYGSFTYSFTSDRAITRAMSGTLCSVQTMRYRQIHGVELFFKIVDCGVLCAVVSMRILENGTCCYLMNVVVENKELHNIVKVFNELETLLFKHGVSCMKVKSSNKEVIEMFISAGFVIEAELKFENNSDDCSYIIRRNRNDRRNN